MAIPEDGPYLTAALLCEKVLQEKDETVSVIRMLDRITLTVPASLSPETLPPLPLNLMLFLSFKSGSARKEYHQIKDRAAFWYQIARTASPCPF